MARFGLYVELSNFAPAQSTIQDFNSVTRVGDQYLATNENGLYRIQQCNTAAGSDIDAHFKIMKSDLGYDNPKRLRRCWIGYECSGEIKLTITVDDNDYEEFTLTPVQNDQEQHMNELNMKRSLKGHYWDFKFENIDGVDFSIDKVIVAINILPKKARGAKIWS